MDAHTEPEPVSAHNPIGALLIAVPVSLLLWAGVILLIVHWIH